MDIDTDKDGGVTITGEDGSSFSTSTELPDGFPSDVPVLDLPISYGMSSTEDGTASYQVALTTGGGIIASVEFSGAHHVALTAATDDSAGMLTYTVEAKS